MKFAIDKNIEVALDREYKDKEQARLDAYYNPNFYYLRGDGDVPYDIIVPAGITRPTLTTALNLNLDHKTTK